MEGGAEELELHTHGWGPEWNELVLRILEEKNDGPSRLKMLRRIAGLKNEEEKKVHHVNNFQDQQVPENSALITHLDYYCNDSSRYMDLLRYYLVSPGLWSKLKCIRVFKLKSRSLEKIIIYTPIVSGFRNDAQSMVVRGVKQEWDNKLALTRRLERFYTRSTLFVLDHGFCTMEEFPLDTVYGRILLARRDKLESQDGRKHRFCKNERGGGVSLVNLEPGFVYPGDVGPVVEYDSREDYRLWNIPNVVFIPKSLDAGFVVKCKNLRGMVPCGDSCFMVLLLDFFIRKDGKEVKIFGKPPPPLDPMVKFHDPRVELFVKQQSLVGVQLDSPVTPEYREGGLPFNSSTNKRVLAGPPRTQSLGGEEKQKYIRR